MKLWLCMVLAVGCGPWSLSAQNSGRFVQAELMKTIKAKSAKVGDPVKARAVKAADLANGVTVPEGATLLGEVHAVSEDSLTISFDQMEADGKKTPLPLSIRAAMLPGGSQKGGVAQTGSVIGMPGVTLQVDDSPAHASKFTSGDKELQLNKGLQLMLGVPH